jgi:hypothetical protein
MPDIKLLLSQRSGPFWSDGALAGGLIACHLWTSRVANVGPSVAALFNNVVGVASMLISSVLGAPPTTAAMK